MTAAMIVAAGCVFPLGDMGRAFVRRPKAVDKRVSFAAMTWIAAVVPAAPLDPGVAKPIESEQTAGDRARDSTVYDTTQVTRDSSPLRQRDVPTEAALIKDARSALDAFPKQALALLAQHAALYPKGVLSEEREVLRIRALKNIGRVGDAEAEEQKFRKAHPGSVHHLP